MKGMSTALQIESQTYLGSRVWVLPVVGATAYPLLVKAFILSVAAYQATDVPAAKALLAVGALACMARELAVPLVSLRALMQIRDSVEPNAPLLRRMLCLAFATPPAQTLCGFAADAVKIPPSWAWY